MNLAELLVAVLIEQAKSTMWFCIDPSNKTPTMCAFFGDFVVYLTPIDDAEHVAYTLSYEHHTGDTPIFVQHEVSIKPEDNTLGQLYNMIKRQ